MLGMSEEVLSFGLDGEVSHVLVASWTHYVLSRWVAGDDLWFFLYPRGVDTKWMRTRTFQKRFGIVEVPLRKGKVISPKLSWALVALGLPLDGPWPTLDVSAERVEEGKFSIPSDEIEVFRMLGEPLPYLWEGEAFLRWALDRWGAR